MFSGYAQNNTNEKLFLKTLAKNVVDQNGLNLESALQILFSEVEKRDLKRIYFELSELGLTKETTTTAIINAMTDNSICMLAVENTDPLVTDVGSRLGGVMILFKKTSLYFSSGIFFTYRYGEVYHGFSMLGGEEFTWEIGSTKTIHSLHNGSTTTIKAINAYEKLSEWGGRSIKARLDVADGTITIPKGINNIMVSATVVLESVEAGDKFLQIFKNEAPSSLMVKQTVANGNNVTLVITPMILDVAEGDKIDLRINSNSLDSLRMKHFTIEVID